MGDQYLYGGDSQSEDGWLASATGRPAATAGWHNGGAVIDVIDRIRVEMVELDCESFVDMASDPADQQDGSVCGVHAETDELTTHGQDRRLRHQGSVAGQLRNVSRTLLAGRRAVAEHFDQGPSRLAAI
jgi:hypothetical protein